MAVLQFKNSHLKEATLRTGGHLSGFYYEGIFCRGKGPLRKYNRDQDESIQTAGIAESRGNSGRESESEEPYLRRP